MNTLKQIKVKNASGQIITLNPVGAGAFSPAPVQNGEIFNDYTKNIAGNFAHAEGFQTTAGKVAHAEGANTQALGDQSHAEGNLTIAAGNKAHAEGQSTQALGSASHAEGFTTCAHGAGAHSEGCETQAFGNGSHSEGFGLPNMNIIANEMESEIVTNDIITPSTRAIYIDWTEELPIRQGDILSFNDQNFNNYYVQIIAIVDESNHYMLEFIPITAVPQKDIPAGTKLQLVRQNIAKGSGAHAEGQGTSALFPGVHAQGNSNFPDYGNLYAHMVGGGNPASGFRKNIHTLTWEGVATFEGGVNGPGADYSEYFEWEDGNPLNEDRVGYIVTLSNDKIRLANAEEEILGVVSGTAMVVGDNAEWEWHNKFLCDEFGRQIWETVEEEIEGEIYQFPQRVLNPEYDATQVYRRRADRPEWDTIGMLGKLHVRDDGTCIVNGYATVGANGIATHSSEKTNMRVMKRINDNIILVLLK